MEDINKVLPCPFCGSKNIATNHLIQTNPINLYAVYCATCGCGTMGFDEKDKALRLWNTRNPIDKKSK